MQQEPT